MGMPLPSAFATVTMSGRTPLCWNAEPLAGAPETRLHFVDDQQHAALVAQRRAGRCT